MDIAKWQATCGEQLLLRRKARQQDPAYMMAHLAEEAGEAIKEWREDRLVMVVKPSGKPTGLPAELADVVLLTLAIAERFCIDLEAAMAVKFSHFCATHPIP